MFSRRLRALELQDGNFARRAHAHGRAPEARTTAHVDHRAFMVVEAGHIGLIEADEEVPREDLATVRVTAQLEANPQRRGLVDLLRLVCEQHDLAPGITPG